MLICMRCPCPLWLQHSQLRQPAKSPSSPCHLPCPPEGGCRCEKPERGTARVTGRTGVPKIRPGEKGRPVHLLGSCSRARRRRLHLFRGRWGSLCASPSTSALIFAEDIIRLRGTRWDDEEEGEVQLKVPWFPWFLVAPGSSPAVRQIASVRGSCEREHVGIWGWVVLLVLLFNHTFFRCSYGFGKKKKRLRICSIDSLDIGRHVADP